MDLTIIPPGTAAEALAALEAVDAADVRTKIIGTDIPVSTLSDPITEGTFRWANVDRPGAEQHVKGYIKYYADMGIDHLRIDFISWFENGFGRYLGQVGSERPREHSATATSGLPVQFERALGPATVDGSQTQPTG